jgi:hypothetical protein
MSRTRILVNHPETGYTSCYKADSKQQTQNRRQDATRTTSRPSAAEHLPGMREGRSEWEHALRRLRA